MRAQVVTGSAALAMLSLRGRSDTRPPAGQVVPVTLQPGQFLAPFLGVVADRTRGVVRLIGIYSQMIHDFPDGAAFVMNEPIAGRRSVLTPICRPVELHVDGYTSFVDFKFATGPHCPESEESVRAASVAAHRVRRCSPKRRPTGSAICVAGTKSRSEDTNWLFSDWL